MDGGQICRDKIPQWHYSVPQNFLLWFRSCPVFNNRSSDLIKYKYNRYNYNLMITSCFSDNKDPIAAGEEVGRKLMGAEYSLVFVNHTLNIQKIVKSIRDTTGSVVFGCSSSYGLSDNNMVEKGVCALGFSFRDLVGGFSVVSLEKGHDEDLVESALIDLSSKREKLIPVFARYSAIVSNMPEKLISLKPYFYLIDFSDPFAFLDDALIKGIRSVISPNAPLVGANAFGDVKLWKSYQILNDVYSNSAVLGIFATPKSFGFASRASPVIKDRTPYIVTKAVGYSVYEINYRPALEVYSEITGLSAGELKEKKILAYTIGTEFPFTMIDVAGNPLMEYPLMVNDDGSILFGTKTFVGSVLLSAKSDRKKVVEDAREAVKEALRKVKEPQALVIFDAWQRLAAMGEDYEKESDMITQAAKGLPLVGAYTMGEHCSLGGFLGHQNGSIVAIALGEELDLDYSTTANSIPFLDPH